MSDQRPQLTRRQLQRVLSALKKRLPPVEPDWHEVKSNLRHLGNMTSTEIHALIYGMALGQQSSPHSVAWLKALEVALLTDKLIFRESGSPPPSDEHANADRTLAALAERDVLKTLLPSSVATMEQWQRSKRRGQLSGLALVVGGLALTILGGGNHIEWILTGAGITTRLLNAGPGAVAVVAGFLLMWRYKGSIDIHTSVTRRIQHLKRRGARYRTLGATCREADDVFSPPTTEHTEIVERDEHLRSDLGSIPVALAAAFFGAVGQPMDSTLAVPRHERASYELEQLEEERQILRFLAADADLEQKLVGHASAVSRVLLEDYDAALLTNIWKA